jgi:hypothetical protein
MSRSEVRGLINWAPEDRSTIEKPPRVVLHVLDAPHQDKWITDDGEIRVLYNEDETVIHSEFTAFARYARGPIERFVRRILGI